MPQLGPAFLHRPIGDSFSVDWRAAFRWWLEGVRIAAPKFLRDFHFKPSEEVIEFQSGHETSSLGVAEKSLLGNRRRARNNDNSSRLKKRLTLHNSLIFKTSVELPRAARNSLKDAVSLRMNELSPIKPEDALVAVGDVAATAENRFSCNVAITRKDTVKAVREKFSDAQLISIGAGLGDSFSNEYTFYESQEGWNSDFIKRSFAVVILWVSLLALFFAVEYRAEKRVAYLEAEEAQLLSDLKKGRRMQEEYALLENAAPANWPVNAIAASAEAALSHFPDKTVLQSVRLENDQLSISGWTPIDFDSTRIEFSMQTSPSNYPGLQKFTLVIPNLSPPASQSYADAE